MTTAWDGNGTTLARITDAGRLNRYLTADGARHADELRFGDLAWSAVAFRNHFRFTNLTACRVRNTSGAGLLCHRAGCVRNLLGDGLAGPRAGCVRNLLGDGFAGP